MDFSDVPSMSSGGVVPARSTNVGAYYGDTY